MLEQTQFTTTEIIPIKLSKDRITILQQLNDCFALDQSMEMEQPNNIVTQATAFEQKQQWLNKLARRKY